MIVVSAAQQRARRAKRARRGIAAVRDHERRRPSSDIDGGRTGVAAVAGGHHRRACRGRLQAGPHVRPAAGHRARPRRRCRRHVRQPDDGATAATGVRGNAGTRRKRRGRRGRRVRLVVVLDQQQLGFQPDVRAPEPDEIRTAQGQVRETTSCLSTYRKRI